jgi:hypothetical protein
MNYLKDSTEYLIGFWQSRYTDYFEAMREYIPQNGYGNFYNDSKIVQCMRDITHNFEDTFSDLRIPEGFSTPSALIGTVNNFIRLLEGYESAFNEAFNMYKDTNSVPVPIYEINKRRLESLDALKHFIELTNNESDDTNSEDNVIIDNLEKVTIGQLVKFVGKLSFSSVAFILSIFSAVVVVTVFVTNLSDTIKSNNLEKDLMNKNKRIEKMTKTNDSLMQVININKKKINDLETQISKKE